MTDGHIDRNRPCGSLSPHVAHPWDGGRRRCRGYGRFAEPEQPAVVKSDEPCRHSWVGPTGIVWDCVGTVHATDPNAGLCGSGHTLVARPRPAWDRETIPT